MPTTTDRISDAQIADHGGEAVILRIDWDAADTPITEKTPCRIVLKVRTGIGTTDFTTTIPGHLTTPLYLYSGIPEQTFPTPGGGGGYSGHVIYPHQPDDGESEAFREDGAGGLLPLYHWLRGYTPRLASGVYYAVIEKWDTGTSAWVQIGGPSATVDGTTFRVLVRSRFEEVYQHRRYSPPPYTTGPRTIDEEAAL